MNRMCTSSWLMHSLCVCAVALVVIELQSTAVVLAATTCSASLPERLESEFSREQQQLLEQILPPVTSQQPVVRAELRAPIHISCQIKPFPHIRAFQDQEIARSIANFEIKPFAQPPHLVFFDRAHQVVNAIPVAPSWTPYQIRDTILSNMVAGAR